MNLTVGRACPQRAESHVFQTRRAARRDGLALPGSWLNLMLLTDTFNRTCQDPYQLQAQPNEAI